MVHSTGPLNEWSDFEAVLRGSGPGGGFGDRALMRLSDLVYCVTPSGWYALWCVNDKEMLRAAFFPKTVSDPLPFYFQIWGREQNPYTSLVERRKRALVTRLLVGIAAANGRYFLRNEEYAMQLKDLVPEFIDEVPLDPFIGSELIYLPAGTRSERPAIYSVGANRIDDGGFAQRNKEYGDIVWQYEFSSNFTMDHYWDNKFL